MLEQGAGCFVHPADQGAQDSPEQGLQGRICAASTPFNKTKMSFGHRDPAL